MSDSKGKGQYRSANEKCHKKKEEKGPVKIAGTSISSGKDLTVSKTTTSNHHLGIHPPKHNPSPFTRTQGHLPPVIDPKLSQSKPVLKSHTNGKKWTSRPKASTFGTPMDVDESCAVNEVEDMDVGGKCSDTELKQGRKGKGKRPAMSLEIEGRGRLYIAVHSIWGDVYQNLTLFLDCGGNQILISEIFLNQETNQWILQETEGQRPHEFPHLVANIHVLQVDDISLYRLLVSQTPKHRWDHEGCTKYHWIAGVLKRVRVSLPGLSVQGLEHILYVVQQAYWLAHVFPMDQSGIPQPNQGGG